METRKDVSFINGKADGVHTARREWGEALKNPEVGLIVGDDHAISGAIGVSLPTLQYLRDAGVRLTIRSSSPNQWTCAVEPVSSGGRSLLTTYRNLLDTACKEQAFGKRPDEASMLQEVAGSIFVQLDPQLQQYLRGENLGPEVVLRHNNLD